MGGAASLGHRKDTLEDLFPTERTNRLRDNRFQEPNLTRPQDAYVPPRVPPVPPPLPPPPKPTYTPPTKSNYVPPPRPAPLAQQINEKVNFPKVTQEPFSNFARQPAPINDTWPNNQANNFTRAQQNEMLASQVDNFDKQNNLERTDRVTRIPYGTERVTRIPFGAERKPDTSSGGQPYTAKSDGRRKLVIRGLKRFKESRGSNPPSWVKDFPCRSRFHPDNYIYDFHEGPNIPRRNTDAMNKCPKKGGRCERCGIYTGDICIQCRRCDNDCECPNRARPEQFGPNDPRGGPAWSQAQRFLNEMGRFPGMEPTVAPEQYPFPSNPGGNSQFRGPPPTPAYFPPGPAPPVMAPQYGYPPPPPGPYAYPQNYGMYPPPPGYCPPNYPAYPPVPYGYPPPYYDQWNCPPPPPMPMYSSYVNVNPPE